MKRVIFTLAMALVLTSFAVAQNDLQPIATVKLQKSEPITLKQVKTRVEAYQKELGRSMTTDEKKKVLDMLINERLVVQACDKEGIKVSDSELNQNFLQMISQQVGKSVTELEFAQMIKQQTGMTLDDFMRAQNGMSLAEYKNFLRSQLLAQRYIMTKKADALQNVQGPTVDQIKSNYEMYKQNFVQSDSVKLFLVVVPKGAAPAESKAKAADFQKQLKDKPSSTSEIKIKSQAANSGFQAGDIYINKTTTAAEQLGITMDSLLKIFTMGVGGVSDVSETETDFQCFVVQEKYAAKILDLNDPVSPGTNVTVYEYIKNNLVAQAQSAAMSQALLQLINELRTADNFQMLKTGADLDKALTW
jgi:hypothetical protein